jgi:hypothetical protein
MEDHITQSYSPLVVRARARAQAAHAQSFLGIRAACPGREHSVLRCNRCSFVASLCALGICARDAVPLSVSVCVCVRLCTRAVTVPEFSAIRSSTWYISGVLYTFNNSLHSRETLSR